MKINLVIVCRTYKKFLFMGLIVGSDNGFSVRDIDKEVLVWIKVMYLLGEREKGERKEDELKVLNMGNV